MNSHTTLAGMVALALALSAVAVPVAGQTADLSIAVEADEVEPGDQVTVTFPVTNDGENASAAIVNVTDRPDWEVANRTDGDGLWRDDEKWLFQTVEAGATVSPAVTLSVPSDASGEYTVSAMVTNGEVTDDAEATVRVASQDTEPEADGGDSGGAGSFAVGPGFGPVTAVVALLTLAVLVRLRDRS